MGEKIEKGGRGDGRGGSVKQVLQTLYMSPPDHSHTQPGRKGARDLAGRPLMSRYSADSRAIPCDPVSLRVIARLQRTT